MISSGFGYSGMERFMWGGGFETVFFIFFAIFVVMFVVILVKGVGQWHRNNNSPRLSVASEVVAKRTDVTTHHSGGDMHDHGMHSHTHTTTWYYVTFEVESGDRLEFSVDGREYGMLAEGDRGKLTFQGTRYLDFVRE